MKEANTKKTCCLGISNWTFGPDKFIASSNNENQVAEQDINPALYKMFR